MTQHEKHSPIWDIGTLPFVYVTNTQPTNRDLPDILPFILGVDERIGHIVQMPSNYVSEILKKAYAKGSMITGFMHEEGLGRQYADDFLCYLVRTIGEERIRGMRILELGCGTGYLLFRLKGLGAEVLGIEPGPQGRMGQQRFNVPIINDFFPSSQISGSFNLIIQYGLLEHVEAPVSFLNHINNYLTSDGALAVAVPDCAPYINHGDISILFHEHWSYFTDTTLVSTLKIAGYDQIKVEKAGFGGCLYASCMVGDKYIYNCGPDGNTRKIAEKFVEQAKNNLQKLRNYLADAAASHETVGIYCPGRTLNSLHLIKSTEDIKVDLRFFDDNERLHGQYYPGFPHVIESRGALRKRPVDRILVMSRTFGQSLAQELKDNFGDSTCIETCKELFFA